MTILFFFSLWYLIGLSGLIFIVSHDIRHGRLYQITLQDVLLFIFFPALGLVAWVVILFVLGDEIIIWRKK